MAPTGRKLEKLNTQLEPAERKALKAGIAAFQKARPGMVPVSKFEVVAAGLFQNGKVVFGHNDEHGMTHGSFHGEDSVLHQARLAFAHHKDAPRMRTLFVIAHPLVDGKPAEGLITPCALCRGKLRNTNPGSKVVSYNPSSQEYWITSVAELLKHPRQGTALAKTPAELLGMSLQAKSAYLKARTSFDAPEGIAVQTKSGRIVSAHNFESAAFTSSAAAGQRLTGLDPEKDRIQRVWVRTRDPNGVHPYTLQAILDHLGGSTAELIEEIVTKKGTQTYRTRMDQKVVRAFSKDDFTK